MAKRKPFELHSSMTVYNFIQVVANTLLGIKVRIFSLDFRCYFVSSIELLQAFYFLFVKYNFNFKCQPVDYSASEHGLGELQLVYLYFLFKIMDLLDTVS